MYISKAFDCEKRIKMMNEVVAVIPREEKPPLYLISGNERNQEEHDHGP